MATRKYQKHTHHQHILELPDTYVGSTKTNEETRWIFDASSNKMIWRKLNFNPGLYKIFDEILVNARDEYVRSITTADMTPIKHIDISVTSKDNNTYISIENDGDGIPIEEDPETKVMIPELIFGHLLTSSNYDKSEEKIVGGKNGYGAKLSNILSKLFTIDIRCPSSGKQYTQSWYDNMTKCEKAIIKKSTSSKGFVKITFIPDRKLFAGAFQDSGITDDMISVFHTRTIELAGLVGKDVKVTWNGSVITSNNFEKYIKLFLRDGMTGYAYEACGPRWEIGAILANHLYSDEEELPEDKHISFANGINTKKGGKHVDNVTRKILSDFCDFAKTKKVDIKPGQLKNSVVLFINSTIVNPSFDSQSKEFLTTPASEFGSRPEYSGKLTQNLVKLGLLDEAKYLLEAKTLRDAKKTDGKKRTTIRGMTKLEDALWAGTARSKECTLILTEGDSAATSAISGLKEVGREKWGVFPLRGKLLNVRDITIQKFNANEELTAIKKILGLEQGKNYKDISELRYGRVMIMADQDHDGSHIKGLLMNLFHAEWPGLLKSGFLCTLLTPILKASKGKSTISFYSIPEFNAWKDNNSLSGWKIKYYKGLGTSTPAEAREWFKDLHEIKYEWDEQTDESINLAFNKKQADDRKKWLSKYEPTKMLSTDGGKAKYTDFVNNELIHFSNADNIRSLPHLIDGLKPSQRKILYSCFKRNLKDEIRVAQLAGYVSEHAAYHHGEASLMSTIIGMAQNFVGSNNINLLRPVGQFGCLSPETPVLLWNGEIKEAKDIIVDDILIGDDGLPRTVLKTTSGIDTMYEIIDVQNKSMKVNSQHILTLKYTDNFKIKFKKCSNTWYFNYYDNVTIKQCTIVTTECLENNHFNKSKLSKEAGYELILKKQKELKKQYNSSTIIDIKVEDYLKLSTFNKRSLYMISNPNCINWEKQDVPIDPYILGAWLGDGDHMGKGFTSCDEEIIKSFVCWLKTIGAEVTHHKSINHDGYHYSIRRKNTGYLPAIGNKEHSKKSCIGCISSNVEIKHNVCDWICEESDNINNINNYEKCNRLKLNPFTQLLRDNNLYGNKHIPINYIINDKNTRLQLLAGFIDTDGTIKENNSETTFIEISQSKRLHENLIKSLDFIAKSLGYSTSIYHNGQNKLTKKGEDSSVLTLRIMGNNIDEIPTRIQRKKIEFSQTRTSKTMHYTKFVVNNLGKGPFNGWQIDGNERFLLGNFVVTHNSRLLGGEDSASPRYIHTYLEDIVSKIFRKEDSCLLKFLDDDGELVEPEYYLPVIPLLAINGSVGIGTGYSTDIPPHKPEDIVSLIRHRLLGNIDTLEGRPLDPWWWGFKGKIIRTDESTWTTKGIYEFNDDKKSVTITELPVGTWTKNYKAFLDGLCETDDKKVKDAKKEAKKVEKGGSQLSKGTRASKNDEEPVGIKGFDDLYNDIDVKFIIYFTEDGYDTIKDDKDKFEKKFKLKNTWKTTNMTCFDTDFNIVKYKTVGDILEKFIEKRLPLYEARRQSILETLKKQIEELDARRRFIQAILDERLILQKKTDDEIVEQLKECNIPPLSNPTAPDDYNSYEYCVKMRIDRVKKAAVIELDKQITDKSSEIERLEAETASSLWMADLDEFDEAWKIMSQIRQDDATSVTKSDTHATKTPRKRKPVIAK
jgi:DNA gyrase/topoisomerase IV subunit B